MTLLILMLRKCIVETSYVELSGAEYNPSHQTTPCSTSTPLHHGPLLSAAVSMLSCQQAAAHSLTEAW